jgi:hypothetical protein
MISSGPSAARARDNRTGGRWSRASCRDPVTPPWQTVLSEGAALCDEPIDIGLAGEPECIGQVVLQSCAQVPRTT